MSPRSWKETQLTNGGPEGTGETAREPRGRSGWLGTAKEAQENPGIPQNCPEKGAGSPGALKMEKNLSLSPKHTRK